MVGDKPQPVIIMKHLLHFIGIVARLIPVLSCLSSGLRASPETASDIPAGTIAPYPEGDPQKLDKFRRQKWADQNFNDMREGLSLAFTETKTGLIQPFRLYVPEKIKPGEKYPLILHLHGHGERGRDNKYTELRLVEARLFLTKKGAARYPCFVVAPQCGENEYWGHRKDNGDIADCLRLAVGTVCALKGKSDYRDYNNSLDPDRIYETGLSSGGEGVWQLAAEFPDIFAAAAPVASGVDAEWLGRQKLKIPLWAFFSSDDNVYGPDGTWQTWHAARRAEGATDRRVTVFSKGLQYGHSSWRGAYAEEEFAEWLFRQRKGQAFAPERASGSKSLLAFTFDEEVKTSGMETKDKHTGLKARYVGATPDSFRATTQGIQGAGLALPGDGSHLLLPATDAGRVFAGNRGPFSLSFWVKWNHLDKEQTLVSGDVARQHNWRWLVTKKGDLAFDMPGAEQVETRHLGLKADARFHHLALSCQPERVELFCDGRSVAVFRGKFAINPAPGDWRLGADLAGGTPLDGVIDQLHVSSGLLNRDDIRLLHEQKPLPQEMVEPRLSLR